MIAFQARFGKLMLHESSLDATHNMLLYICSN